MRRHSRRGWVASLCAVLLTLAALCATDVLHAQVLPGQPPGAPTGATRTPSTARRTASGAVADSGARQLSKDRVLVEWAEPDSIMRDLMQRAGYRTVQYQSDQVRFETATRQLVMRGKPSAVKRDETILVGDTIVYDDSTKLVVATGDTVVLRDPSADDADDFVARGAIRYDLQTGEGTTRQFATSVMSGQRLFITAEAGTVFNDTTMVGARRVFFHDADFTYCDHDEPHFHFTARDIKFVSEQVVVGRNAVLYIGEVPVFWLPFMFQDARSGRRSGLLTPSFGVAELLRNSTNYQRRVENLGWFFALNDYADAEFSMDWLSAGSGNTITPGWLRGTADVRYKWINRFIDGGLAVTYTGQSTGTKNTAVTWRHNQQFSKDTRLSANVNWTQNTTVQRQTTFNPQQAVGTMVSQLNYQTRFGPARVSVGGTRRQYPGRDQVDMDLPNLSLTTGTLKVGPVEWTPSLRFNQSRTDNIDQGLQFGWVVGRNALGALDSTRVRASRRNTNFGFDSPLKIFDFQLTNQVSVIERFDDYPEQRIVRDVRDTSLVSTRVFAQRFFTSIDWTPSFNLPRFFQGTWNVSPTARLVNVDQAAGLIVRSELSGGRYVSQGKRLEYGLSSSPTFYARIPGVGPIEAIRHSISPVISYNLSPAANVSDEFLQATGRTRQGYLGSLPRNAVSLSLSTNFEAKLKPQEKPEGEDDAPAPAAPSDSTASDSTSATGSARARAAAAADQGRKIRLLSLNFSSLSYDFVRADTAATGLVESNFSISARSDLLPNFDFRMGYSLFQGDPISDTAVFKPFRTELGANFALDGKSSIVALLGRLVGLRRNIERLEDADSLTRSRRSDFGQQRGGRAAAGAASRGNMMGLPSAGEGWRLALTYNSNRQRPFVGGTAIDFDPTIACRGQFIEGSLQYQNCVALATTAPPAGFEPGGITTPGGPVYRQPASENLSGTLSFGLTPNWSASLQGLYDVPRNEFSSLQMSLQRELHDWNAVFSFVRAPNGNVAFTFFIALKASPEIKFDYRQQSVR